MNSPRSIAGRGAEIAVGLAYLAAAGLKAWNFNLFIGQILAYQIFSSTGALTAVAFATLALETFLGLSMVLGSPWRRQVLVASAAMLLFFTGLIVFAWQVHNLKDCGCFGKVPMTPPEAIAKNLVLLALTALAWYGLEAGDRAASPMSHIKVRKLGPVMLALLVCLAAVPQVGGTVKTGNKGSVASGPDLPTDGAAQPAGEAGVFAEYRIVPEYGDAIELAHGEYLVALLSMTCEHCMGEVPQINDYIAQETLPQVVAICLEPEEGSLKNFQDLTGPLFPMHSVGNDMLAWAKICSGVPPQLSLIRDGVVVKTWKDEMPPPEEILIAMEEGGSEESVEAVQGDEAGAL
jgi:hypothetical protein